MTSEPNKGKKRSTIGAPRRRDATVRLQPDVARRVQDGHPWVFEDALQGRKLSKSVGDPVDLVATSGEFLARALFDPGGPLALRVFSRQAGAVVDPHGVVQEAARLRRDLLDICPTSCLRVINGDSEGLPAFNADRYGDYIVISMYSAVAERYLEAAVDALVETWSPRGVYLQRRYQPAPQGKARPPGELIHGEIAPLEVVVSEGRFRFGVDVSAPLGTGIFADMRLGRQRVAKVAAGRRTLNCFSYTGAFSLVAALSGAKTVVSVDSAARAHARATHNFHLNGIDDGDDRFQFLTGDSFAVLTRMAERKERFDLVVLDPPTFSSAKGRTFTAIKDYAELVAGSLAVLEQGGLLLAASNAAKLPDVDFERAIGRGAERAGRRVAIVDRFGQPADYPAAPGFPEGRYLKVAMVRAMGPA
ncbi:MAG: class I SAM-dependent rRNA methyltransferase [Deltaproteobacteria bacterium]|nr:class I SAM-dependent rRNA methyltransferase [Deltaproteobacteria bacterium]